jgi:hypothetical protein
MLNILICAFGKKANETRALIDKLMQELGLQDESSTSIVAMRAQSCDGKKIPRPYLWLRGTDEEQISRVIKKFKAAGLRTDLEWDIIDGFIPAERMIPEPRPQQFNRSTLTCFKEGPNSKCEPNKRPRGYCNGCGG